MAHPERKNADFNSQLEFILALLAWKQKKYDANPDQKVLEERRQEKEVLSKVLLHNRMIAEFFSGYPGNNREIQAEIASEFANRKSWIMENDFPDTITFHIDTYGSDGSEEFGYVHSRLFGESQAAKRANRKPRWEGRCIKDDKNSVFVTISFFKEEVQDKK